MSLRILHVDDDPDIRAVVELSLTLDPDFKVRSCANGDDALAMAPKWAPDMVLCDVMMPGMDGPTLLARLRENPQTRKIPVVFMTACAQVSELDQLKQLGAAAVFTKPFDPMTLAASVRSELRSVRSDIVRYNFADRMRTDAAMLAQYRRTLSADPESSVLPEGLQSCVHKLSGAAGVFNFQTVSSTASALEDALVERRAGRGTLGMVEANLDALIECIEHE
jgi:two-component system OmpR family response regulator